jgi:hypothetical protein
MFDAWTIAGVGGGSAALTYIAAGRKLENGEHTFRISLDKSGSLLGDVRLLGGALTWLTSMYVKNATTKKTLQTVTAASVLSLVQTEMIRWRLKQSGGTCRIAGELPLAPSMSFGALPNNQHAHAQHQGAWAHR